jgi:hypothetical protein
MIFLAKDRKAKGVSQWIMLQAMGGSASHAATPPWVFLSLTIPCPPPLRLRPHRPFCQAVPSKTSRSRQCASSESPNGSAASAIVKYFFTAILLYDSDLSHLPPWCYNNAGPIWRHSGRGIGHYGAFVLCLHRADSSVPRPLGCRRGLSSLYAPGRCFPLPVCPESRALLHGTNG